MKGHRGTIQSFELAFCVYSADVLVIYRSKTGPVAWMFTTTASLAEPLLVNCQTIGATERESGTKSQIC